MRNLDGKKSAGDNPMNHIEGASNLAAAEGDNSGKSSVREMEPQSNGEVRGKDASYSGGGMPLMPKLKLRSVDNYKVIQGQSSTKNDKQGHSNTKNDKKGLSNTKNDKEG